MFSQPAETKSTRHYYSNDKLFEKSLDIYKCKPRKNEHPTITSATSSNKLPIVILVVGSGWMGHRAFVYGQTSWWNSSGPKTIASLGTTCVCIRHRGAFCVVPAPQVMAPYFAMVLAVVGASTGGKWEIAIYVTALLAALVTLLALGGQGSARLEDMLEDVAEALVWINNHRDLLETTSDTIAVKDAANLDRTTTATPAPSDTSTSLSESTSDNEDFDHNGTQRNNASTATPIVFGGYSSGGHVATTLLQQPERFRKHGLLTPDKLFQGILVVSGMMAVRPEKITIQDPKTGKPIVIATPPNRPRWLTDFVLNMVWGVQAAKMIPSPLAGPPPPALPHLLVGCRNEVFGLPWLDIYFCSAAYRDKVEAVTGKVAKYVEVESDHWFILSSTALRYALKAGECRMWTQPLLLMIQY
jgi:hypothetical protein